MSENCAIVIDGGLVADAHFAGFVLCDFVLRVLFAALALAIGAASLRDVDLHVQKYVSLPLPP